VNKSVATSPAPDHFRKRLREQYDRLWTAGIRKIRSGQIEIDPILAAAEPDRRRGLTVVARPGPAVRHRVAAFLSRLRGLEPDQYFYAPAEFHVTVLSLFTATVKHAPFFARARQYTSAVDAVVSRFAQFQIDFKGITVSPGAIMIQGFVQTGLLNDLRDALRHELHFRGFVAGLDRRYRLETAHMTVARFRAPLRDSQRFAAMLERLRQTQFGAVNVRKLSLVKNDWYMTHQTVEMVKQYLLKTETA